MFVFSGEARKFLSGSFQILDETLHQNEINYMYKVTSFSEACQSQNEPIVISYMGYTK